MAFDPVAVAAAVALAQINQKLDGIQATMDQMFDYLRGSVGNVGVTASLL